MALIVPHISQAGISVASGGRAASPVGASAFVTPGQQALPGALNQLAAGMNKLGGVIFDAEMRKRNEQMELALLEDMQAFQSESQAWADGYQKQNQGRNAVNAETDARAFYGERVKALRDKWEGNERAQLYIQRNAGGVAVSGVNAMRDYGNKQQEAWKDSVFAGQAATFKDVASDWRSTPDEIQTAYKDFAGKNVAYLMSKGMDATAAQIQTDRVYREAMGQRTEQSFIENINNGNITGARAALDVMAGKVPDINSDNIKEVVESFVDHPNVRAFLNFIARSEGTAGRGDDGYNVNFGGSTFADYARHPNERQGFIQTDGKKNVTTAAGRYQFLGSTYEEVAGKMAVGDFSPRSQDLAAVYLMAKRGALKDVIDGDAEAAIGKLGAEWASLPSSPYAQPKHSGQSAAAMLEASGFSRGGVVSPDKIHSYQQVLQVAAADSQAEDLYSQIASGSMAESKAWEQIAGIEDLKVRRAVRQGLTERLNIVRVQEREETLNAGERAYDDMTNLANSKSQSEAAILSDMYKLRLDAEIKARTGSKADKAYFRSVEQMYSSAISGLGITNRSDPGVFIEAQNAIMYGKITSSRDLKAAYPALAFRDMERLESVLKSSQQVSLAEINRLYDIYAGLNPDLPADAEERAEHKARRMMLIQNVIDSAKETNRGNDPEWIKTKVSQFFVAGEDRGFLYDADMTAGEAMTKGVTFYPEITEEVRARIKANFDKDPVLKDEYLKKHEHLNYAIRARYWDELQQGLGAREPERPDDVPDDAVWDKARMGWVGTNPQTGRPGFRPLVVR